jgi:hypothetical protein
MKTMRDISEERGCSDVGIDVGWTSSGKCHILTELSAEAVMKPPLGKSGNAFGGKHATSHTHREWHMRQQELQFALAVAESGRTLKKTGE